jgi:hypothetical protein
MADQNPFVLEEEQLLCGFCGAEIAVAGNLMEGNFGKEIMETFTVPPAIAEMKDHMGGLPFNGLRHVFDVAVRVGKNQNLHEYLQAGNFSQYTMFCGKWQPETG